MSMQPCTTPTRMDSSGVVCRTASSMPSMPLVCQPSLQAMARSLHLVTASPKAVVRSSMTTPASWVALSFRVDNRPFSSCNSRLRASARPHAFSAARRSTSSSSTTAVMGCFFRASFSALSLSPRSLAASATCREPASWFSASLARASALLCIFHASSSRASAESARSFSLAFCSVRP